MIKFVEIKIACDLTGITSKIVQEIMFFFLNKELTLN